jgi:hypothetical protein
MSSSDTSSTKWMVAVVDKVFSESPNRPSRIVKLKDPSTQESRQYVFVNDKHIVEVQSLPADFSSFFVGRHIIKDGNLYVLNRVDPLFFVLAAQIPEESKKYPWQPFDQTLQSLPQELQKLVVESQMGHLCQTLNNDQTDNVTFLKLSVPKALSWLQKKQERVYQCLLRQDQAKKQREKSKGSNTKGGSISASFNMPEDPMAATPSSDNIVLSDTKQLKIDSIQIVSSYLSEEWSKKLIESLDGMTEDAVFSTAPKVFKSASAPLPQVEADDTPAKRTKLEAPRTFGNKRLAQVSTKGMKSLGSFFGAPKSKKSKTQQLK